MFRFAKILAALVMVVTLGACQGVAIAPRSVKSVIVKEPGPPSHAPAHGYRRKHESGADLQFDPRLGVYIVVGHTDVYFYDGWFIRLHKGAWQVSATLAGPWEFKAAESLPPGLRLKQHSKKPKARGLGPAKAAW